MTQETDLPSILAAEALLLTLVTFLYGLSYPELVSASALKLGSRQPADIDVEQDRERVRQARRRAGVLAAVAAIIGAVFAAPSAHLSWHFLRRLPKGLAAFDHYDAVATSVVLVTFGCFLIAGHATWMVGRLANTLTRLSPRR
jgi:hypothetical protein